jgi:hypothetical protein
MAVTVPVQRKRKMREGESRARPWCATERRVWGGGGPVGAVGRGARGTAVVARASGAHQVRPRKEMVTRGHGG